ncbi:MAG: Stp1/IreP family PP2C-type Ser/Thr phosphatase [Acutalibacteraceae bacterium]|nr:Stp1/IreP family PP2C-type Ser/Thr phosphatase [Acutalibacteraceae bacterium]
MKISAKTDVGMVRSNNQDSYSAGDLTSEVTWAVVCDGMGGANGGNVASETAVKVISDKLTSGYHIGMNDNSVKNLIVSAIEAANMTLFSMARNNEELSGMGTTVVLAVRNSDTLYLSNVGDSRIYIVSDSGITQVTTDHSVVQIMLDRGEISPEEAKDHPKKNVITRALGVDPDVRIDYSQEQLNENDIVLLCTDGLTNYVDDETILEICRTEDKYKIADKLVELANENGGGDNITVVTVSE